jgi:hypothetical protein
VKAFQGDVERHCATSFTLVILWWSQRVCNLHCVGNGVLQTMAVYLVVFLRVYLIASVDMMGV